MPKNPIDKQRRDYLAGAKRRMAEAVDLATRCQRCGMDIGPRLEWITAMIDQMAAIEQEFFGISPDRAVDSGQ